MLQKKQDYMQRDQSVMEHMPRHITKKIFGGILLLFGVVVAFWILSTINSLLVSDNSIDLLRRFDLSQPVSQAVQSMADQAVIPPDIFLLLGYIITITLLFIMVRVAKLLIKSGAGLLQSDLQAAAQRLKDEVFNLRDY